MRGAASAPSAIRAALASPSSNLWTESGIDLGAPGVLNDAGDLALNADGTERDQIERSISQLAKSGSRIIALGGDHSITYPLIRATAPHHEPLTIVQFDAHPDLYDAFEGDRFSHACQFARILEEGLVKRLVQVGIRTMNAHQRDQAARFGVEVVDMRAWAAGVRPHVDGPVYVSFDMDGLDPAFAPGVSHREPGGLTVREALTAIQSLQGPLVGADIVEYNPDRDVDGATAPVCAKIVKELASRMLET